MTAREQLDAVFSETREYCIRKIRYISNLCIDLRSRGKAYKF